MKITWHGTNYGQIGFHAEMHEYDAAPPVDSLLLDHAPASLNPERMAIAAYLAFGLWASGDLQLPRKLGPNTAGAIENDLQGVALKPGPIEYYPKALEVGLREVVVGFDECAISDERPSIAVLPASTWVGALRTPRSISVASNAFTLDEAASGSYESVRARLAVAVLFAADLSADTISFLPSVALPDEEKARLRTLMLAARLGVNFQ